MSKFRFGPDQRYAVFTVYDQHCYICRRPLTFRDAHIDHVIPEALLADPAALALILRALGLPDDFDLNDFGNWLPACGPCNITKGKSPFEPSLLIQQQLQRARDRADRARATADRAIAGRQLDNALATLERGLTRGALKGSDLEPFVDLFLGAHPKLAETIAARSKPVEGRNPAGPQPVAELRLDEAATIVLFSNGEREIVVGRYGTGYRPLTENPHPSFYCGHCGSLGPWSGARCMSCGMLDDGD